MSKKTTPKLKNLQGAFFGLVDLSDKLTLANSIRSRFPKIFNGEPMIIPMPSEAPEEVPRVVLKSQGEEYRCNISANRIDFFYEQKEPKLSLKKAEEKVLQFSSDLGKLLVEENIVSKLNRLGIIFNFFINIKQGANKFLDERLLKQIPTGKPYDTRIHFLYHDKIGKYEINRWIRLNPLRNLADSKDDTMLSFVVDINTLTERKEEYKFGKSDIDSFYSKAVMIVRDDLKKYFGNQS